ncbi:RagB/SusD family nutrient uptake outer membrane protein [Maribacter sp. MAR_2009_72]|uniref:RagB/SusD family nutrient uptake outer membrane protein n=1 Tax=Maribacter sp. MAR_2009_72 TaxID=1250050 RepID=UPI00119A928C|nr:RagB/SusD family nutrient uptake outer membrane protein [Maribacter sp. MAR_2009_72]TVZ17443.1 putative outer membrane starch-binding protein [Maribacter sp. MAR_2009_72]
MKTFKLKKTSLLLGALLLASMSCSDEFLQVAPTDSLADSQVSTKAGIDGLLIGTYSALNGVFGNRFEGPNHWATGSVVGGDANKGTDAGDYSSLNPIQRYEASPVDPNNDFNNLWRGRYEGVSRANKVLSAIANSTELTAADATRLSGEARMLRGHFYFDLKKHFNNIVVFDETVAPEDLATLPNNGDAWAIIESDLQYAYDNLPAVNGAGRVNKWAAGALLAKAKLYQQKFGEAKDLFDDVIENGVTSNGLKYDLLDDYAQIYNAENDNHAEAVFDVESANNTGNVQNANAFDDLNYPYNTGPDGPGNCCGFFQPSFEMANSYRTGADGLPLLDKSYNNPENVVKNDFGLEADEPFVEDDGPLDPRIDHAIGRRGIPYLDWIEHPGKAWIRSQPYAGPYSPKKYIYYRSQENSFTDGSSWTRGYATMNYTIIRFADVLLMAAEAEIEAPGGSLDTALEYVNRVRRRAANSEHWVKEYDSDENAANYVISEYTSFPNADFARDAVRFERKLELSGEGHRFFDLVRWGVAAEELNEYLDYESTLLVTKFGGASFVAGKNEYFPIPQAQIDITGSDVLQQNPGY